LWIKFQVFTGSPIHPPPPLGALTDPDHFIKPHKETVLPHAKT
jgi:hypothetical protein